MRHLNKVLLAVLAAPAIVLGSGFVYGVYLAATGQAEPQRPAPTTGATVADLGRDSDAAVVQEPSAGQSGRRIPASVVDAESTKAWLTEEGLAWVVEGSPRLAREAFAALHVDDCVRLHAALQSEGKDANGVRMLLFAGCAELPRVERREFATRAGAVWRPGLNRRGYIGDFTHLLRFQTGEPDSVYARAVRRYAEVLESDEVTGALEDFGAIIVEPTDGRWHLRVESKLAHLDAETLMALRGAIGEFFGLGDRKYLRKNLLDLAQKKRRAQAAPAPAPDDGR